MIAVRRAAAAEVIDVRHAVLRAGRPRETAIFDGDDAETTAHWVAERDGRVIGVVTLIAAPMPDPAPSPRPLVQLRGMAVLPEHQGHHVGDALLLATHGREPLWCNAREAVVGFYARRGWQAIGPTFVVEPIGPHQRMWWRPA